MESFDDFIKNKNHSLPEKEDLNVEVVLEAMRRCTLSEKHLEKTNLSKTEGCSEIFDDPMNTVRNRTN